jgi:hypothetical protein
MLGLGSYISYSEGDIFELKDIPSLVSHLQVNVGFRTGTVGDTISVEEGEAVDKWYDRKAGLDWDAAADSQRPVYKSGGLDFDGVNDSLDVGQQLSLTTFHFFMVIDLEGASNETAVGVNGSSNFLRFNKGGNANEMRYKFGSSSPTDLTVTTSSNIPTGKFLFELSRTSAGSNNLTTIFDGSTVSTDTLDVTKDWIIRNIGAQSPGGANPAEGIIFEMAVFDKALEGADLTNARADIQARNGL